MLKVLLFISILTLLSYAQFQHQLNFRFDEKQTTRFNCIAFNFTSFKARDSFLYDILRAGGTECRSWDQARLYPRAIMCNTNHAVGALGCNFSTPMLVSYNRPTAVGLHIYGRNPVLVENSITAVSMANGGMFTLMYDGPASCYNDTEVMSTTCVRKEVDCDQARAVFYTGDTPCSVSGLSLWNGLINAF